MLAWHQNSSKTSHYGIEIQDEVPGSASCDLSKAILLLRAQSSTLRLDKPGPHQAVSKDMENVKGICKLEITTVKTKRMANTCELPSYQRTVLNDLCNFFFLLLLGITPCAIITI